MKLAWHNNADLKAVVLDRMIAHREDDEIVQGIYQETDPLLASGYRGCLIGCTLPKIENRWSLNDTWHELVETHYGIPVAVAYLLDYAFESLFYPDHAAFAVASIEAIPVGADLAQVPDLFALDLLAEAAKTLNPQAQAATSTVAELVRRHMTGDEPTEEQWSESFNKASELRASVAREAAERDYPHYGHALSAFQYARKASEKGWAAERLLDLLRSAPIAAAAGGAE